ncbi:hypothetical protein OIU78_007888 [Salix suchowensis]|nr:hypothetical protein OIU78_007888 [Salix suchowensis]
MMRWATPIVLDRMDLGIISLRCQIVQSHNQIGYSRAHIGLLLHTHCGNGESLV